MRVILIRHGRSSHVHAGWIDRAGFLRWREAYEAAGISDGAPAELQHLIAGASCVVASDTRRAIESARAVAPTAEVITSPLLSELELLPPNVGPLRLPMLGWLMAYTGRWLVRTLLRRAHQSAAEEERIRASADWIEQLSAQHETVVIVTHAWFRRLLTQTLVKRGWTRAAGETSTRHWSAWIVTRRESGSVSQSDT